MTFTYINSLDRPYDNTLPLFNGVIFYASRYGQVQQKIKFNKKLTEAESIKKIEYFLSSPLTKKYYDSISKDLFCLVKIPFKDAKKIYKDKGECLGSAIFIEETYKTNDNYLKISCGS